MLTLRLSIRGPVPIRKLMSPGLSWRPPPGVAHGADPHYVGFGGVFLSGGHDRRSFGGKDADGQPGWGFGLGFTAKTEAGLDGMPDSVGSYSWIGVQGTSFWVDPQEALIGVFMVQIRPNRDITFRQQFRSLVYQAMIE